MVGKICGIVFFAIGAILSTYVCVSWWKSFGAHEVYPYIMTFLAAVMWWLVYLQATEKED